MLRALLLSTLLVFSQLLFAANLSQNMAVLPVEESSAGRAPDVFSFTVENDIYFSDRYYTNGLKAMYTSEGVNWWLNKLQFLALESVLGHDTSARYFETIGIGQDMYVPTNIDTPNPPLDDRPYCGWLYASFASHIATQDTLDSFGVNLGVVGPISLAEDAQKFWHSIIGADWPMGWQNQIKNEPGIILTYKRSQRLVKAKLGDGAKTDFIGSAEVNLGNVRTNGMIRAIWRIGFNLPDSFDSNRIDDASSADVVLRGLKTSKWSSYFYCGGTAKFVGYDISLNGNTFADSREVVPNWFVGEGFVGIANRYENVEVGLNWTIRSGEYTTQEISYHMFWSLNLRVFF